MSTLNRPTLRGWRILCLWLFAQALIAAPYGAHPSGQGATVIPADLYDPQTYVASVPHDTFAWLRANDPVHWQEEPELRSDDRPAGTGYWALTRYDEVVAASRDSKLFSSYEGTALIDDLPAEGLWMMRQQLIHMDPPDHTKLRKIVNRGFTPRIIRSLDEHVAEITRSIVDAVAAKGECDFVKEVAAELPLQVIAELLGVPIDDRWKLFDWSNRLIGLEDPEYGSPMDARAALLEMFQYAAGLAQERRNIPSTTSSACSCTPRSMAIA